MCNPSERKKVQFASSSCAGLVDPEFLEHVEKRTNAFIRPLKEIAQFEISGTELAVTLALSQLEERVGLAIKDSDVKTGPDNYLNSSADFITISPASQVSSSRLTDVLQRALSQNSDGICSADDYKGTKPSIQRVLVSCLQNDEEDDIDDDLLFADGKTNPKQTVKIYTDDDEVCPVSNAAAKFKPDTNVVTDTSSAVANITDKLTETQIAQEHTVQLTNEQKELRKFGLSLGYEPVIVDMAVKFVHEKTRPSDFIDILTNVKLQTNTQDEESNDEANSDVEIIETETIEYSDSKQSSPKITKVKGAEAAKTKDSGASQGKQTLPEAYFEKLLQDYHQEEEICDVEELKRRNSERQELLKQKFQQKPQTGGDNQAQGAKKKKKRAKKNKQGNLNQIAEQSDPHDDSPETRTFSNDTEQTCLLHLWNNESRTTGESVNSVQNDQVQLNPWKKNPKGDKKNTSQNAIPSPAKVQQPKSPYRNQGAFPKQGHVPGTQGGARLFSPYKANDRKPMQVVAPVNHYRPQQPQAVHIQQHDLRYIVIDGSNVAMT